MRILAVDHGERRLGIAVSDVTGTLARPLTIVQHQSREADARRVQELARAQEVDLIVVGESRDEQGKPNQAGRRAQLFAGTLRASGEFRVELWDESLSSQDARRLLLVGGASRKSRTRPIDAVAAAVILQSYLDAHNPGTSPAFVK